MGGGASSSARIDSITKSAVEAVTRSVMNCGSTTNVSQKINISGSGTIWDNVKISQYTKLSFSCFQAANNLTKIKQDISNALMQKADAQNVALLGVLGNSESEIRTRIYTDVSEKITNESLSTLIAEVNKDQLVAISGDNTVFRNVTIEQTTDLVFSNVQQLINSIDAVQQIKAQVEQESSAKTTNPISEILDSVFGGLNTTMMIWVVGFVIVVIVIGPALLKYSPLGLFAAQSDGDDGDDGDDGEFEQEYEPDEPTK